MSRRVSRSDRVCVLQVDVCIHVSTCMYCVVCMQTHGRIHYNVHIHSLHAGAQECLAVTEFVSCRLTSVYMYLHACTVLFVCTHMDVSITMYIYILYMQVLNECHAVTEFVSCRLTSVYMYLHACTVLFVCTHMDVCITMYIYILYMQVLNGCLAVTEFVSCRLTSILHACTVPFVCTHMEVYMHYNVHIHAGAQWVSCS